MGPFLRDAYQGLYGSLDDRVVERRISTGGYEAFDIAYRDGTIYLFGAIGTPMAEAFEGMLDAHDGRVETVQIDSGGGIVGPAFRIGHLIADHGLDTRVETLCASACILAFGHGKERQMGPNATLACHFEQGIGLERSETLENTEEILDRPPVKAARDRISRAAAALHASISPDRSPEEEAEEDRDALLEICSVPSAGMALPGRRTVAAAGLVTHWQHGPGEAYRPVLSPEGFLDVPSRPDQISDWTGLDLHRRLYDAQLRRTHATIPGSPAWRLGQDDWAYANREGLNAFFQIPAPEPLCLQADEVREAYERSREYRMREAELYPEKAIDDAAERPSFAELMRDADQAEGCPTSGFTTPVLLVRMKL